MKKAAILAVLLLVMGGIGAQAQTKPAKDSTKTSRSRSKKKAEAPPAPTPAVTPATAPKTTPAATPKTVVNPPNKSSDKAVGTDAKGRTIYEGPRGGRYVLTAKGNKEYLKKQ